MKQLLSRFFAAIQFTNLLSLQVFQLLRYGTFVLIGVGFAKLHIAPGEIGRFETLVMISGMVSFFWVSGIINSMLSAYPKHSDNEKKTALFTTFILLLLLSVVASVALFAFSNNLLAFIDKKEDSNLIVLALFYIMLNCPAFITEYILFLNERKHSIIYYGIGTTLLTLVATLTPAIMGYPIQYSMYGLIVVAVVKLAYAFILLGKYGKYQINIAQLIDSIKLSLPLMLSLFVSGSAEYIDGLIVKAGYDDVAFAVYRYGAKELPFLLIIANTFSTGMIPAIANNLNNGIDELKRKSTRLMHIFFPITVVLMVASPYLYVHIFNSSFLYSAFIFNIYLLLIIPRVLFPQTIITATQQTKYLLISATLEIIINVSLSIYLSQKMGLPGIALGSFIAYSFDKVFQICINAFVLKIKPTRYIAFAPLVFYSLLTVVAFAISFWLMTD